jgi:hypothetical protein
MKKLMAGRRIDGHRHVVSPKAWKRANAIDAGKASTICGENLRRLFGIENER